MLTLFYFWMRHQQSCVRLLSQAAFKGGLNVIRQRGVKIGSDFDFAFHRPRLADKYLCRNRDQHRSWFPAPHNHDLLALLDGFDQFRELGFGIMNINGSHTTFTFELRLA